MKYLSVAETAKRWRVAERTVRNYCANGKIPDAFLTGKTWSIPESAQRPDRANKRENAPETLLDRLRAEKEAHLSGGIYHKVQIELTYNSNRIEGSRLTQDQTRYIFETNTIGIGEGTVRVDDVVETANHFRCIDRIIDQANATLSENFIKQLHQTLKSGTSDARKSRFAVGGYKKLPNEVGGKQTTAPEDVSREMKKLLNAYNAIPNKTLDDILDFHVHFERIHPFQDGNGRVGRLILFKECLRSRIVPFIISDELKVFYYRGLQQWSDERGYLRETCVAAQDQFKQYLDYFRINY
ncbi:MAG: Fic family protein [Eubacteriales bacterium]|nr:Fic family protein [Eubacteriales bacterium]